MLTKIQVYHIIDKIDPKIANIIIKQIEQQATPVQVGREKEYLKQYYLANRESIRKKQKEYQFRNSDKIKAYQKKYREKTNGEQYINDWGNSGNEKRNATFNQRD